MLQSPPFFLRPARKVPRYSVRPFYTSIAVFTTLTILSLLIAWVGKGQADRTTAGTLLLKRDNEPECRLVREVKDQCAYVRDNCPDHQDGLFSYLQLYYCALPNAKPLAFLILILWLSLLFSTIGIAASDFLCIDLSTLASILGLSESLTGVTFLAFGNGSPDVFSTFAAMRSNSGSLAIGELIGAASFITTVVAGSMALVRPFKVARRSFVRDVGYFVIAVTFSMFLLADGRLHVWESAAMVALYAFYVFMVVTWHWYLVRRRKRHERDMAARTHFHIPDNQELEYEQPLDDDDPGVASDWKEEDEEDDETRNRYLAEIRDNMHVYRPQYRSRRNTMNPIRASLVGALEFQSVLHSLEKSRNIRHGATSSLGSYSDEGNSSAQSWDTRSVASHPRATRPSAPNDRLSPHSAEGSRARAVSANDADRVELDPSVLGRYQEEVPQLTIRRPSEEVPTRQSVQPPRIDTNLAITLSPSASTQASPSGSPVAADAPQTPDLLAPPAAFSSPNYQSSMTHDRSPQAVSPRGTSRSYQSMAVLESPSAPFPIYVDDTSAPSSRAPSIRLPNPVASPAEQLLVHDPFDDRLTDSSSCRLRKWWPDSVLPPPQQLACTLFPTLAGWKGRSIMGRFLGIVAAPSVFLLTITVPVVEPQASEYDEPDPIPAVVIEQVDTDGPAPRIRLPADSPTIHPMGHGHNDSIPGITTTHPHPHKHSHDDSYRRPRWDSELPAAPPPPAIDSVTSVKDWNRWLVSIQLFTGPFFFALIAWTTADTSLNPRNFILPALISLLFSFICLALLIITTRSRPYNRLSRTNHSEQQHDSTAPELEPHPQPLPHSWRPVLSMLGFLVAISWIATIATEVVSLLKTIGVILDISDSLLGLTVFAVGNSLGDLVADITVARLGYPVMALSACFGGPMLNILLGIGLGGLYMTVNRSGTPSRRDEIFAGGSGGGITAVETSYEIEISKVLVISGATLLVVLVGLLIVVPLNGWRMDKRIGWGLIVVWCISTIGNVIAELT
ncbi:Sodium/calcium exchanger membrane region [Penicillium waksmanii]|uniref:Sodium/calcium exchanger membrane region n=1 Tax=Penicillium waksmanii TaxID=69791 RepID=UPI002549659E|nr:Sodium/calcium exchanger membrane region [Penicillium waksmanii]KAJ5975284.1 Sodium/calcium exchanger membrane region [Penicillium waksmanii]